MWIGKFSYCEDEANGDYDDGYDYDEEHYHAGADDGDLDNDDDGDNFKGVEDGSSVDNEGDDDRFADDDYYYYDGTTAYNTTRRSTPTPAGSKYNYCRLLVGTWAHKTRTTVSWRETGKTRSQEQAAPKNVWIFL